MELTDWIGSDVVLDVQGKEEDEIRGVLEAVTVLGVFVQKDDSLGTSFFPFHNLTEIWREGRNKL